MLRLSHVSTRALCAVLAAALLVGFTIQAVAGREDGAQRVLEIAELAIDELALAAHANGITPNTRDAIFLTQSDVVFAAAPLAGIEHIPPREYVDGVDTAFAFLNLPTRQFEPGFYILRIVLDGGSEEGLVNGRLDLVPAGGSRSIASYEAQAEVFSAEPLPLADPHSVVTAQVGFTELSKETDKGQETSYIEIKFRCPNGLVVHIRIEW